MSWTPTDEQALTKKIAQVLARGYGTSGNKKVLDIDERVARAVLVGVGPMIAAQGVREYVAAARENGWIGTWDAFDALNDAEQWADTIEKEAGR